MQLLKGFSFQFKVNEKRYVLSTDSFFDDLSRDVGRKVNCSTKNGNILLNFGGAVSIEYLPEQYQKVKVLGLIGFSLNEHEYIGFESIKNNYVLGVFFKEKVYLLLLNDKIVHF